MFTPVVNNLRLKSFGFIQKGFPFAKYLASDSYSRLQKHNGFTEFLKIKIKFMFL